MTSAATSSFFQVKTTKLPKLGISRHEEIPKMIINYHFGEIKLQKNCTIRNKK